VKALTWHGKGDIRCDSVPDPTCSQPGSCCEDNGFNVLSADCAWKWS
jgi:Alcohol dehydrogenase GroES-associated